MTNEGERMRTSPWNPYESMDYPHCEQCPTEVPIRVHDASLAEPTYVARRCDWEARHEFDAYTAVCWTLDAADRPYRQMHVSCAWCLITQDTFCVPELRVSQPGVVMATARGAALGRLPRLRRDDRVGAHHRRDVVGHARAELAGYRSATEPPPPPRWMDR